MIAKFVLRWFINAVALWVAAGLVPGIFAQDPVALIAAALIFGVINASIGNILRFLTCPLIAVTLGLFTFVINAVLLLLTSWVAGQLGVGFQVADFGSALLGALVVTLVSVALNIFIRAD